MRTSRTMTSTTTTGTRTTTTDRRHAARGARVAVGAISGAAFGGMLAGFLLIPQPAVSAEPQPATTAVPAEPAAVPAEPAAVPTPAPAPDVAPPSAPVDATTGGSGG